MHFKLLYKKWHPFEKPQTFYSKLESTKIWIVTSNEHWLSLPYWWTHVYKNFPCFDHFYSHFLPREIDSQGKIPAGDIGAHFFPSLLMVFKFVVFTTWLLYEKEPLVTVLSLYFLNPPGRRPWMMMHNSVIILKWVWMSRIPFFASTKRWKAEKGTQILS